MSDSSSAGGVGFLGLLLITFIVLKLTGVVGWSWWWVTAPVWGPPVLGLVVLFLALFVVGTLGGLTKLKRKARS